MSSDLSISYCPSRYIFDQDPAPKTEEQLIRQEDYEENSKMIVANYSKADEFISDFPTLINDLADLRKELAQISEDPKWEDFGKLRSKIYHPSFNTKLGQEYCLSTYSESDLKIRQLFRRLLQENPTEDVNGIPTILVSSSDSLNTRLKIEIFNKNQITDLFSKELEARRNEIYQHYIDEDLEEKIFENLFSSENSEIKEELKQFLIQMKKLKTEEPTVYNDIHKTSNLYTYDVLKCRTIFANRYTKQLLDSTTIIQATSTFEIDGKEIEATRYLAAVRTNLDGSINLDDLEKSSRVLLIHQDKFLTEETMQLASHLFKTAIDWNKENLDDLKENIAHLRYVLAQGSIYLRGSAAISEWIEAIIYNYHNLSYTYKKDEPADLKAFELAFLSDFTNWYQANTKVSRNSSP